MVTEDPITKIWAKSYGIDCLNVNEAELLIFQNYDVNLFRLYNPYANDGDNFDPSTNILQNTIDTTLYSYSSVQDEPVTSNYRGKTTEEEIIEEDVAIKEEKEKDGLYQLMLLLVRKEMNLELVSLRRRNLEQLIMHQEDKGNYGDQDNSTKPILFYYNIKFCFWGRGHLGICIYCHFYLNKRKSVDDRTLSLRLTRIPGNKS